MIVIAKNVLGISVPVKVLHVEKGKRRAVVMTVDGRQQTIPTEWLCLTA